MKPDETTLAVLQILGQKSSYTVRADRVAVHCTSRPTLYFVSAVGSESAIGGLRATLAGRRTGMTLQFEDCAVRTPDGSPRQLHKERILLPSGCKFKAYHQKLRYGLIHAMFAAQSPDFLLNVGPESLWVALNSPRFTTPILREWMPSITQSLLARKLLTAIHGMRCRCGLLALDTARLDAIVAEGIRAGRLPIRSSRNSVA